jgi:tetratricopeptide (TPR) repeat protein
MVFVIAAALASLPVAAVAQQGGGDAGETPAAGTSDGEISAEEEAAREKMLGLSEQANQRFQSGDFSGAAEKFEAAYDAFPDPVLLKNQMVARFKADQCDRALPPARSFLDSGEASESDKQDVRTVIITCELRAAEKHIEAGELDEAAAALSRAERFSPDETQEKKTAELRASLEEARAAREQEGDIEDPEGPGVEIEDDTPILAYSLIGGGVASLAAGGIFHAIALGNYRRNLAWASPDSTEEPPDDVTPESFDSSKSAYATQRTMSFVLYGVGGAALGTGLVLFLMDSRSEMSTDAGSVEASIAPVWLGDGAGASLELRF